MPSCLLAQRRTAADIMQAGLAEQSDTGMQAGRQAKMHTGPSVRGDPPKKGINKEYQDLFPNFSVKFPVLKLRFLAFPGSPGGFRELREAYRKHFHLSWYLEVPVVTSYGQKSSLGPSFTEHCIFIISAC